MDPTPPLNSPLINNLPDAERRESLEDRRTNPRQGKLDRRRNRCSGCERFKDIRPDKKTELKVGMGFCEAHEVELEATNFACLMFTALRPF